MKHSNKSFTPIAVIIIAAAVLALAGGEYWWWQKRQVKVTIPILNQYSNQPTPQVVKNGATSTNSATTTVSFHLQFKDFDISLFAPNQVISKAQPYAFCGTNESSAAQYDGMYQITAKKNNRVVSTLPIGQKEFISGSRIDGLHIVTYTSTGNQFIVISQYGSCNGDFASFYTIDEKQHLINVPFLSNRTSTIEIGGGFDIHRASTDGTFCSYNNGGVVGNYCDVYQYKNYSFVRTDSWIDTPTDIGRARRYIVDFWHRDKMRPSDLPNNSDIFVDDITKMQTSTLPYTFRVEFTDRHNDYKYIFEITKTQNGFEIASPPKRVLL